MTVIRPGKTAASASHSRAAHPSMRHYRPRDSTAPSTIAEADDSRARSPSHPPCVLISRAGERWRRIGSNRGRASCRSRQEAPLGYPLSPPAHVAGRYITRQIACVCERRPLFSSPARQHRVTIRGAAHTSPPRPFFAGAPTPDADSLGCAERPPTGNGTNRQTAGGASLPSSGQGSARAMGRGEMRLGRFRFGEPVCSALRQSLALLHYYCR
ncbi:hypothetical protein MRB53_038046 [Persea americana]|nr:hypothetical protein MRB53_038046 [Persea americana]